MVHGVALEAADRLHDRRLIAPRLLHLGHVVALRGLEDARLDAREHLGLTMVVGALHDGLVDAIAGGLHVLAEELANRARDAMSPARGVDDERRSLHAVTAAEELGDAGVAAAIR